MKMNNFVSCKICKNGWIINDENNEAIKCECLKLYQQDVENESIINNSNLPIQIKEYNISRYIGKDKNENIKKLKKYIDEFEEKFKYISLYVWGTNSTQKTTVLGFFGKELAKKGFSVYYCLMNDLVKDLCNVQFKKELQEKIDTYNTIDCLLIDESFDLKKMAVYESGYQLSFIDSFLRTRIEQYKKSTIFISNISIDSIDIKFGKSIIELLKRNCKNTCLEFKDSIRLANNFEVKDIWKE